MTGLNDTLAAAWADDLKSRLPDTHLVFPMRRPASVEPPFSVVTVMRMEQVMPGSNAWIADIKVVCVCDKDQGGSSEQNLRVGQMYQALEGTASGSDIDRGIELCGFTVDEVRQAKAEKVYSDVIFITAGVAAF